MERIKMQYLMCIVNVASSSCSLTQSMRFTLQVCISRVNERVEVVGEKVCIHVSSFENHLTLGP